MPAPVTLDPKPSSTPGAVFNVLTFDDAIQERALEALLATKELYPSRVLVVDAWHPIQSQPVPGKPAYVTWFRIAENIQTALTEKHDRWFQEKVGVIQHKLSTVMIPVAIGLAAEDRLVVARSGESLIVTDSVIQSGVEYCTFARDQAAFKPPATTRGTVRIMFISGRVG